MACLIERVLRGLVRLRLRDDGGGWCGCLCWLACGGSARQQTSRRTELVGLSGENISGQSGRGLIRQKKYIWEFVTLLSLAMDHEQKEIYLQAKQNRFIFGGMDIITPPSPVRKPFDPSIGLTDKEWDKMNERRNIEMEKKDNIFGYTKQSKAQYEKNKKMVEALLGGKKTWKIWQDSYEKNSSIEIYEEVYDFRYLDFFHELQLNRARFNKPVAFWGTAFAEEADFAHVTFADDAYFPQAIFAKKANFWQARFTKEVSFILATFAKEASFLQATFQSSGSFHGANFYGNEIDFSEMILSPDSNLIFAEAKFKNAVPDFRYLNRNPDIRFHGFSVPSPYELIKKWQSYNEDRYRKLKELAIGGNNHEYELLFYGYEMDSKLKNFYRTSEKYNKKWWIVFNKKLWKFCHKKIWRFFNKKWWKYFHKRCWVDIVPTYIYKHLAIYGQSMWRPFIVLLVLALIACSQTPNLVSIVKTILPLPLFVTNFGDYKPIESFGLWIKIFATVFWFLLFLAVRNKFKIK